MNTTQTHNAPLASGEKPGFYSVTPASVRYDENLSSGAKLLYGEITALSSKEGYCWAGNAYFASLYKKDERTIRNWINALRKAGHIAVKFKYAEGSKEIQTRIIELTAPASGGTAKKNSPTPHSNSPQDMQKTSGGGENFFHTWGKKFPQVGKISSTGGEKNFRQISTANNNTATTTPASPQPPPPAAAAAEPQIQEFKAALLAVDKRLVFDRSFYPRALAFMHSHRLDARYLSWLYRECLKRNPRVLAGLYFKLFFAENIAEQFTVLHTPPPKREPEIFVDCPACGTRRESRADCPECGLGPGCSENEARRIREIYALPERERKQYFERLKDIRQMPITAGGGRNPFAEMRERLKRLDAEFGIKNPA